MKKNNIKIILPILEKLFWLSLVVLLVIKYLLITKTDSDFLNSYKFVSSDSYDWLANGFNLMHISQTSLRSIGLPFIIYILQAFKILFLLPLINQIAFFGIIYFMYKIVKELTINKFLAYLSAFTLFINFNFQNFSEFLLADFYAIVFIEIAVYFLLKRKYLFSFFSLGLSILFQNFAYFLLPFWLIYVFFEDNHKLNNVFSINNLKQYVIKNYLKFIKYILVFININIVMYIYKIIHYHNPLYSGLDYFSLIRPNLNSVIYQGVNSFTMFGIAFIFTAIFVLLFLKKLIANYKLTFLLLMLIFNIIFWVIIYDWDDRRFLLYFIPFFYPLYLYIVNLCWKTKWKWLTIMVVLFTLYTTSIFRNGFFDASHVYLTNWNTIVLPLGGDPNKAILQVDNVQIKSLFSPYFYDRYENKSMYKSLNSIYLQYSERLNKAYNSQSGNVCMIKESYDKYTLTSIFNIKYGIRLKDDSIKEDCEENY